jgi:adenine/guanine phosphoribosyltransferase-like PRPP-binding protein
VLRDLLPSTARVMFVDDWIDTGAQAVAAQNLIAAAGITWCGASVIVDAREDPRLRRDLTELSVPCQRPVVPHRSPPASRPL